MSEQISLYKVVRPASESTGHYMSCSDNGRILGYEPNKPTRPHEGDGPLAAFDTIEHAEEFLREWCSAYTHREIWKATCVPSAYQAMWRLDDLGYRIGFHQPVYPDGTVLCDEITITEKVR